MTVLHVPQDLLPKKKDQGNAINVAQGLMKSIENLVLLALQEPSPALEPRV